MRRIGLAVVLSVSLAFVPLAGEAQQAAKVARIGCLWPTSPSDADRNPSLAALFAAFREGLREMGYVDGQNIKIESRWAEGNYDRLPGLAADLVSLKVDVIVTYGTPASQAAKRATGTIPIVMATTIDPVASGLVTSLARPGGSLTGQSGMSPDLVGKQLEILKEVVPKTSRVALLHNPANPGNAQLPLGIGPPRTYLLTVPGRKTGRPYSTPVTLVEKAGQRWLVAPYGEVGWVLHARAAGHVTLSRGGRSERVGIVELGPDESAPVLRRYVTKVPIVRPFFDAKPEAPVAAFVTEARRHPVFRITQ
jgi:deazaflavin-dependent oxidoreductase (nitroreductase family)